jgi:hypothetical protein
MSAAAPAANAVADFPVTERRRSNKSGVARQAADTRSPPSLRAPQFTAHARLSRSIGSRRRSLAVAFNEDVVISPGTRHQRHNLFRDGAINILRNHDPLAGRDDPDHSTPRLFFDGCLRHGKVSCALHILSKSTNRMSATPQTHRRRGMTIQQRKKGRGAGSSLMVRVGILLCNRPLDRSIAVAARLKYRDFAAAGIGGIPTASRAGVASGNKRPRERRGRVGRPWHRTAARGLTPILDSIAGRRVGNCESICLGKCLMRRDSQGATGARRGEMLAEIPKKRCARRLNLQRKGESAKDLQ